jgi:SagB-type dehydrogenase family enzyme
VKRGAKYLAPKFIWGFSHCGFVGGLRTFHTFCVLDKVGLSIYRKANASKVGLSMREVVLPKPDLKGSIPLEQTIAARRSQREFSSKSLTWEQIGQLAWAAQGQDAHRDPASREPSRYRTVPSAGATYPLELFVVTEQGFFRYLPGKHALAKLTDQDLRGRLAAAAWGQEFIAAAPVTLVFAAEFARTTGRYGERGIRYVYMEAGHAAQNVHLQAEALGLGSVPVGAFDDASVGKVLELPSHLEPLYMVPVGYCPR